MTDVCEKGRYQQWVLLDECQCVPIVLIVAALLKQLGNWNLNVYSHKILHFILMCRGSLNILLQFQWSCARARVQYSLASEGLFMVLREEKWTEVVQKCNNLVNLSIKAETKNQLILKHQ